MFKLNLNQMYTTEFFSLTIFILGFSISLYFFLQRNLKLKLARFISVAVFTLSLLIYAIIGGWHHAKELKALTQIQTIEASLSTANIAKQKFIENLTLLTTLADEIDSAVIYSRVGHIYNNLGLHAAALRQVILAIRLEQDNPDYLVQYANILLNMHELFNPNGKKILDKILSQEPTNTIALNLTALYFYQQQDYAKAIETWQKLLGLLPKNSSEYISVSAAINRAKQSPTG